MSDNWDEKKKKKKRLMAVFVFSFSDNAATAKLLKRETRSCTSSVSDSLDRSIILQMCMCVCVCVC